MRGKFLSIDTVAIGILILGIAIRVLYTAVFSLWNDELSSLYRSDHQTFTALVREGVQPDGHPFLAQTIIWITRNIAGTSEFVLRFPFLLTGIVGIWGWYKGACSVCRSAIPPLALLIILCFVEHLVMLTTIARPYALGFCATGWAFAILVRWKQYNHLSIGYRIAFVIALTGAVFSHYIAGLTVFVLYLVGLFWLPKQHVWRYMGVGLGAVILFLPHLPITLNQFEIGGIGWLQQPNFWFLVNGVSQHLPAVEYVNGSLVFAVAGLILAGFYITSVCDRVLGLTVFCGIPLGICIAYSWLLVPLLHDLVMVFMIPFATLAALLVLTHRLKLSPRTLAGLGLFMVLHVVLYSAPFRSGVHHGDFKHASLCARQLADSFGEDSLIVIANMNGLQYADYYNQRLDRPLNISLSRVHNLGQVAQLLDTSNARKLVYFTANRGAEGEAETYMRALFSTRLQGWSVSETRVFAGRRVHHIAEPDSVSDSLTQFRSPIEFINGTEHLLQQPARFVIAGGWISTFADSNAPLDSVLLVICVERNNQLLIWQNTEIKQVMRFANGKQFVSAAIALPDTLTAGAVVKAFWWNQRKAALGAGPVRLAVLL